MPGAWLKDRKGRGDPARPRGLPALIPMARDTDQDFKQDIPWLPSRKWMGEGPGVVAPTSAWAPGHMGAAGAGAPGYAPARGQ